jgi:hypothetical protein
MRDVVVHGLFDREAGIGGSRGLVRRTRILWKEARAFELAIILFIVSIMRVVSKVDLLPRRGENSKPPMVLSVSR